MGVNATDRLLAVGWDAADGELIRRMLAERRLPVLAGLLDAGAWTPIDGYAGVGDDAHWTSFSTGTPPGVHGRFHFEQAPAGEYQQTMLLRDQPGPARPWWVDLADRGITASVLDVPKSPYVPHPGVAEIVDWMCHGADSDEPSASAAELHRLCLDHRPHGAFRECYRTPNDDETIAHHVAAVGERRTAFSEAAITWMRSHDHDLNLAVFPSAHCLGHHYPLGEAGPDRVADELEALDTHLGRLIEAWGGDPGRVVVFSLLGMHVAPDAGPETEATVRALNRYWLQRHPTIGWRSAAKILKARAQGRRGPVPTADVFTPVKLIAPATAIRLNLEGRERRGIVPASRREEVLAWLVDRLHELRDDEDEPVLAEVLRTEEAFPGPRHDALADVLAVWRLRRPGRVLTSITDLEPSNPRPSTAADHRRGGWMVTGAGLTPKAESLAVDALGDRFGSWLGVGQASAAASTDDTAETE